MENGIMSPDNTQNYADVVARLSAQVIRKLKPKHIAGIIICGGVTYILASGAVMLFPAIEAIKEGQEIKIETAVGSLTTTKASSKKPRKTNAEPNT